MGIALKEVYTAMLNNGWSPEKDSINKSEHVFVPTLEKALLSALSYEKNNLKESTYGQYQTAYNRFMEWCKDHFFAGVKVNQFKRKQFPQYLNYLSDQGNNPTSINNNKRAISALFSKLVADFVIEVNPIAGIVTKSSKPLKNRPFTVKQFNAIIEKCNEVDLYLIHFIKFMIYAMLRPREVIRLKKSSIKDDLIFVDTKKGMATISIIDKLKPLVNKLVNESKLDEDNLLSYQNKPMHWTASEKAKTNVFTRRFKKIKDQLGLDATYGLYRFRHTAIYHLYQSYLKEGLSHSEIVNKLLPITRHKSEKELTSYLREVGAMLPPDYSERFTFNL